MRTYPPRSSRAFWCGAALAGLAWLSWCGAGFARVEADPRQDYHVTAEVGPWVIMITSYSGESAQKMAHDLVLELRERFNLPAYVFNRGKEERAKQEQEVLQQRHQQLDFLKKNGLDPGATPLRVRKIRIEEQYAVLVGGYKDIDAARKDLDKIKKLEAPKNVPLDSVGIAGPRENQKVEVERAFLNPFKLSFVVRNPQVPVERPKVNDYQFLKDLNAGESYSLLKCSKPWTLVVKEFFGETKVIQSKNMPRELMEKLFGGGKSLDASALQAHEVARVLRDHMKLEAYVLHTRHGSIVAVGGYDTQDDPRLLQNQRTLQNLRMGEAIQFFAQPLPMAVPKP